MFSLLTVSSVRRSTIKRISAKIGAVYYRTFKSTKMISEEQQQQQAASTPSSLVMQLIVDSSLFDRQPGWSMGPMMAQAGHATSAIIAKTYTQPNTQSYLSLENLPKMRKIVLKTKKGESLNELSEKLIVARQQQQEQQEQQEQFPDHHLWIEQPENIPTVLAIAPNNRPSVSVNFISFIVVVFYILILYTLYNTGIKESSQ